MYFDVDGDVWRYEDDDSKVSRGWNKRPCKTCGEQWTEDKHDPCIANLSGVMNACCGHGDVKKAYVQFDRNNAVYGLEAIEVFKKNGKDF